MRRDDAVRPHFPPDAFAGTAPYYARYRVPYPRALMQDLVRRAGVTGEGRLLDLACGPGRVAFALAGSFREIWAIDLEPEMIEVGKQEAAQRGVSHIRWMVGKAEELTAPPAGFEMVSIGEAFHRLDQEIVAGKRASMAEAGGLLGRDRQLQCRPRLAAVAARCRRDRPEVDGPDCLDRGRLHRARPRQWPGRCGAQITRKRI